MSEEYISRKAVRDAIAALAVARFELTPAYRLYVEALDNVDNKVVKIPKADVKPVIHGHWAKFGTLFECSECEISYEQEEHYCPWCGAKMDAQEETHNG